MLYVGLAYYFTPPTTITKKVYLANGVPSIPLTKLPSIGASKYSYELWVYVNHVDTAVAPNQSQYGTVNLAGNIFNINTPDCISFDVFNDGSAQVNLGGFVVAITDKFPLQRWEYVIINIDNNFIEIYLDGKLLRSVKTPNPISTPVASSMLSFGKGDIYISAFNRNLYTIGQSDAYKNYLNGNNGLRLTNFGVSFDFLKNSDVAYNFQLF
jgi:hypothetical protein